VVAQAFAGSGVEVVAVESGAAALQAAAAQPPDAVLCDVLMPEMSGYEVLERLKSDPSTAHVPVLLLTGAYEPFDEDRATRGGAAGFLAKPFETRLLQQRIEEVLSSAPQRAAMPAEVPITVVAERVPTAPSLAPDDPLGALEAVHTGFGATRVPLPGDEDFRLEAGRFAAANKAPSVTPVAVTEEAWREDLRRIVEALAPDIVREVAWEVVPDLLERLLRESVPPPPASRSRGTGDST
jgi:CheY-like chemotaxis protein